MADTVTITNPTTTPTVYSQQGHVLEAGGRLDGVALDDVGHAAIQHGFLAIDTPAEPDSTDAEPTPARRDRKSSTQVP